jgi:hypothetical protein
MTSAHPITRSHDRQISVLWTGIKELLHEKMTEKDWTGWLRQLRLLRVMPCSHDYATRIADLFQRRRNSYVLVSPLDWLLIEVWAAAGIPRAAVERGIDTAFERYRKHDLVRQINSINFCQSEVLRAAKDMVEASVGSHRVAPFEDAGQTLLVALPPRGWMIFATLQNQERLFTAAQLAGMGLALTVYPDPWHKSQAQERFGQDLEFLDEETA